MANTTAAAILEGDRVTFKCGWLGEVLREGVNGKYEFPADVTRIVEDRRSICGSWCRSRPDNRWTSSPSRTRTTLSPMRSRSRPTSPARRRRSRVEYCACRIAGSNVKSSLFTDIDILDPGLMEQAGELWPSFPLRDKTKKELKLMRRARNRAKLEKEPPAAARNGGASALIIVPANTSMRRLGAGVRSCAMGLKTRSSPPGRRGQSSTRWNHLGPEGVALAALLGLLRLNAITQVVDVRLQQFQHDSGVAFAHAKSGPATPMGKVSRKKTRQGLARRVEHRVNHLRRSSGERVPGSNSMFTEVFIGGVSLCRPYAMREALASGRTLARVFAFLHITCHDHMLAPHQL